MVMRSVNPATGEEIERFKETTLKEVNNKISLAAATFEKWREASIGDRAVCMRAAAALLRRNKRAYGKIMTTEMGKPITEAVAEAEKCVWVCEHYADAAEGLLADEDVATEAKRSFVRLDPSGPLLAVMPWNFPFWQVFRFIAPSVMAGNVGLLKHASNVPRCALTIQEIMEEAGFPKGVFQTLLIGGAQVEKVIRDPRIKAASLTGSEKAGASVAAVAGASIKKLVLELGGSDAFIVLDDADLKKAAKAAAESRCINTGQSCIAAKRFIVHKKVHSEFVELFKDAMRRLRVGDPMKEETRIGPLARDDIRDELDRQVRRSVSKGAKIELGGRRIKGPGYYFEPTILSKVGRGMPVYHEETFGPVAAVIRAVNEDDAMLFANDSDYGLGSSLWTQDYERAMRLVSRIDAGMVFVNRFVKSDPRLPFGGVKKSGYGRELGSWGLREFVNAKTVWVEA